MLFDETLEILHFENHFINLLDKATETKGTEKGQYNSAEHTIPLDWWKRE